MKNPGFIGAADIRDTYLPMGFSHFKIEGRGLGSALLLEFLLHYMTKPEYHLPVREEVYLDSMLDPFLCSQSITSPEFGPSVCPVKMFPSGSEARRRAAGATSLARPKRPKGSDASFSARHSSVVPLKKKSVSIGPGAMQFTVIPVCPTSLARDFVRPIIPALAAQ